MCSLFKCNINLGKKQKRIIEYINRHCDWNSCQEENVCYRLEQTTKLFLFYSIIKQNLWFVDSLTLCNTSTKIFCCFLWPMLIDIYKIYSNIEFAACNAPKTKLVQSHVNHRVTSPLLLITLFCCCSCWIQVFQQLNCLQLWLSDSPPRNGLYIFSRRQSWTADRPVKLTLCLRNHAIITCRMRPVIVLLSS